MEIADCYFAKKEWHGQQPGEKSVLVADSSKESLITMYSPEESLDTDGYIEKIEISSALREKFFYDSFNRQCCKNGLERVDASPH